MGNVGVDFIQGRLPKRAEEITKPVMATISDAFL